MEGMVEKGRQIAQAQVCCFVSSLEFRVNDQGTGEERV